jgi:hypothetical protein
MRRKDFSPSARNDNCDTGSHTGEESSPKDRLNRAQRLNGLNLLNQDCLVSFGQRDRFDMERLRKHINGLDRDATIAALREGREIPRQSRWVA